MFTKVDQRAGNYVCESYRTKLLTTPEDVYGLLPGDIGPDPPDSVRGLVTERVRQRKLIIS